MAATAVSTLAIGVLVAAALWGVWGEDSPQLVRLDLAVAVTACALVAAVVRWPIAGGIVAGALAMLSPVATPVATFAALHAARWRRFPAAAAVALAGMAGQAVQGWWRPFPGLAYGWWLLLMTAAYAALLGWGTLAQARHALLESLRERARRAEAEQDRRVAQARLAERASIAWEMHDVLAHRLSLLATYAGAMEFRPDAPPQRIAAAAGVVRANAHQALEELREVITLLRRDSADADDTTAPRPGLAEIADLVEQARAAGQRVDFDDRVSAHAEAPAALGGTVYRVVQEALTNARKHAPGQPVSLTLAGAAGNRMTVDVRNPLGPASDTLPGNGIGLVGLAERVSVAGGQLDHQIDPAGHFHLHAWLPWKA